MHEQFPPVDLALRVSVPRQTLDVLAGDGRVLRSYPVSTSRFGLGAEPGSLKTPLGRFVVAEKHGDGLPSWSILKSRRPTGEIAPPGGEEDHVLTRILWLDGVEEGNANTKDRYIYIHGTNQEELIGRPASHGCVRLRNDDVRDLYDLVPVGCRVVIEA